MSGPRKKSLVAGVYAAGSLADIQGGKYGKFPRLLPCRNDTHTFIEGHVAFVCTKCGYTKDK